MLSYNAILNFIIGERGVGKTYGAKKHVVNRFIKKGEQFVYLRRYKTELKDSVGSKMKPKFFNQIVDEFPDHELSNSADTMYIDGKICGIYDVLNSLAINPRDIYVVNVILRKWHAKISRDI